MGIETSAVMQVKIKWRRYKVNRDSIKGVVIWIKLWWHCDTVLGGIGTVDTMAVTQG